MDIIHINFTYLKIKREQLKETIIKGIITYSFLKLKGSKYGDQKSPLYYKKR